MAGSRTMQEQIVEEQLPRWRCDSFTQIYLIFLAITLVSTTPSLASTPLTQTNCSSEQFDETSTVRYIHDGDTLHLTDGRKIRLIGINTPELARDSRPAEPFSIESKNALQSLFKKDKSISLVFGKDKKDRYGRFLAHAFLADGSNAQAALLQQGLASVITIPPNTRFASCYLDVERSARCNKTGLWKNIGTLEAKTLKRQHTGFHIIKGTIRSITTNNKGVWLNLDDKLTVGIRPENQKLFDLEAINNMANQTIIVRGWLNKSNKSNPFYLRVRHPLSIQLPSSISCE
jgi:endonuclease YncB( thermonuclease family)